MLRHLARLRVSLGFVLALAALWLASPTPRGLAIGSVVAIAGEIIRLWAAGHLEKGREVTSSGPYAFTRHPLYLGSTVMGVGLAIASSSIAVAATIGAYLLLTLTAAIRTEEAHLTEKFGSAYPEYRNGRVATVARAFSMARAMRNREYRAVIGLTIAFAILALKIYLK